MKRIWILSEHYYPEETATGHILGHIGEGLTDAYDVRVICAQPSYLHHGSKAPSRETHAGVEIFRCWSTNLNRHKVWTRLVNLVTISLSVFFAALFRIKRGDMVLVVTNPPLLPFLARFVAWLRRTPVVLLVHDVFPEGIVASGVVRGDAVLVRLARWANGMLYRSMDHIVVLGRDMKALVLAKMRRAESDDDRVSIIPNWADVDEVRPAERGSSPLLAELGLLDKLVIQYAGNMGYAQDIATILAAAARVRDVPDVHFLFIGSGAKQAWLEHEIERQELANVTRIDQRPRNEQDVFLNACDVAIMALVPGMLGLSVPSRSYNILAAGKPILGVLDKDSEIALMIEEEEVGWTVEPADVDGLVATIRAISRDAAATRACRARSRAVAEGKYTVDLALDRFRAVFDAVSAG